MEEFVHKFFYSKYEDMLKAVKATIEQIPKVIEKVIAVNKLPMAQILQIFSNDSSRYISGSKGSELNNGMLKSKTTSQNKKDEILRMRKYFANFENCYEIVHLFSILNAYQECYISMARYEYNKKIRNEKETKRHNNVQEKVQKHLLNALSTKPVSNNKNNNLNNEHLEDLVLRSDIQAYLRKLIETTEMKKKYNYSRN